MGRVVMKAGNQLKQKRNKNLILWFFIIMNIIFNLVIILKLYGVI